MVVTFLLLLFWLLKPWAVTVRPFWCYLDDFLELLEGKSADPSCSKVSKLLFVASVPKKAFLLEKVPL